MSRMPASSEMVGSVPKMVTMSPTTQLILDILTEDPYLKREDIAIRSGATGGV